jgi:hypothetical protein
MRVSLNRKNFETALENRKGAVVVLRCSALTATPVECVSRLEKMNVVKNMKLVVILLELAQCRFAFPGSAYPDFVFNEFKADGAVIGA